MPCNVQPNPAPFEDFPNTYTECVWEIVKDIYYESSASHNFYYSWSEFFPSSDDDPCTYKFPDGKARYYFAEVTLYARYPPGLLVIVWSNGLECKYGQASGNGTVMYKAWFDRLWAKSNLLFYTSAARLPSHVRVWRTVCGEFNPNWPVPPDYKVE